MSKKSSLSVTLKAKKNKKGEEKDPCMVCDRNLYYNAEYSRRIGLVDENCDILGWMCPHCGSEFNQKNELITLKVEYDGIEGKA